MREVQQAVKYKVETATGEVECELQIDSELGLITKLTVKRKEGVDPDEIAEVIEAAIKDARNAEYLPESVQAKLT